MQHRTSAGETDQAKRLGLYQQAEQNMDTGLASAATVVCVGSLLVLSLLALRALERGIHYES